MRTNFYLNGESPEYILYICKLSHIIIAIGNVSKDFTTRDITSKKVREPNLPDPYIEVFARAIDTIVEVVKVLSDNYHIRTAVRLHLNVEGLHIELFLLYQIIFTFRRMVDCAGEHIMKCIFLLIKEGILRSMTMPEVADILHLFVQLIAKLQV